MRALLTLLTLLAACTALAAAPITIVEDHQPRAAIVLPDDASDQLKAACNEMQALIEQSTGAKLEILTAAPGDLVGIHVGPGSYVNALGLDLGDLDDDGYLITFPDANNIVMLGPTDYGTEFGVYEFLERYVGVRWLLPGPDGTDVPEQATIQVPTEPVREEPAFFSRLFSGLRGGAQATWARRNRMHGRVSFHHNLIRLFPPEQYTETHPEFFPIRGGERLLPAKGSHGWQPCFTAEGIVEEAISNIIAYFDEHPDVPSYSLGVNDSSGHCECETCRALDPGRKNLIGRDHLSDRYFTWANAVVEGVLEEHPDKYFGCLAYSEIFEPPDRVQVHERIIPYMTYDRMKWVHEGLRAEGEELTRNWAAMSPTLAWYDYIYGTPYCLPRVWFHHMADYYRFGHDNGVRCLYAEAYPNWGEGPKLYVSLKLQWDPYRDVDELLDEWYERCVGPEAAPSLKAYYAHWEDFWTRRILDSAWFTEGGQYLRFSTADYLADIELEEIAESRRLLEATVAATQTDKQRARAELLLRAFEYYEASALAYPGTNVAGKPVDSEESALAVIEDGGQRIAMSVKRRQLALEEFADHPILVHPISITRSAALSGAGWGATSLWQVYDWVERSAAVRSRIQELADTAESSLVRDQAQTILKVVAGTDAALNPDPSFEEAGSWSTWVKWGVGSMGTTDEAAHTGDFSMLCDGMKRGGPHQGLPFEPGRYAAVCFVHTPEGQETSGTVELSITPRDPNNANLAATSTTIVPQPGRWQALATGGEIPAQLSDKDVATLMLIVVVNGFEEGDKVYIDDVNLFRLGPLAE